MCKNVQKSYYGPCKTNESESGRRFQRFYYEKTLVGWEKGGCERKTRGEREREGRRKKGGRRRIFFGVCVDSSGRESGRYRESNGVGTERRDWKRKEAAQTLSWPCSLVPVCFVVAFELPPSFQSGGED